MRHTRAASDVAAAMADGHDGFCTKPTTPLSPRARSLCVLGKELAKCPALIAACNETPPAAASVTPPKEEPKPPHELPSVVGSIATLVIWGVCAAVIVALLVAIGRLVARARADRELADERPPVAPSLDEAPSSAAPIESDAELLLRRAQEHAAHGALDAALFTYLQAALHALDRRGAIRIARHRTNGEYVRTCKDQDARAPLRGIVREVDAVQFGGAHPSHEGVARVSQWATSLVRAATMAIAMVLLALGCSGARVADGNDPAGDELFLELLRRQGVKLSSQRGSLATLPLPTPEDPGPALIVDAERVPLDDDVRAHLMTWVRAGGVLVLIGRPSQWPHELEVSRALASGNDVEVLAPIDVDAQLDDDDDGVHTAVAHLPSSAGLSWHGEDLLSIANFSDGTRYAATQGFGAGRVIGIADDDLLSNVSLAYGVNADALISMLEWTRKTELRIARPEDGTSPPSSPFAAITRLDLGVGVVHLLVAIALLFAFAGSRLTRPTPSAPPRRRAFAEHIAATGALYARTSLHGHALAAFARHVDERLRARMPRDARDVSRFLAERAKGDEARTRELLDRALHADADPPDRRTSLSMLRELGALYAAATSALENRPTKPRS